MTHLKTWWAAHVAWIAAVAAFFVPSIQNFITSHPGGALAALGALVLAKIAQLESTVTKSSETPASPATPTLVKK